MSDIPPSEPERMGVPRNRKGSGDKWGHLSEAKRAQYEAIEARVRDKVERGEL